MNYIYLKIINENQQQYAQLSKYFQSYIEQYNHSIKLLKNSKSQSQFYHIINQVNCDNEFLTLKCKKQLAEKSSKNNYRVIKDFTLDFTIDDYEIINFFSLNIIPLNLKFKVNNEADKIIAIKFSIKEKSIYCEIEYAFTNSILNLDYSAINYDKSKNQIYLVTNKINTQILVYDLNQLNINVISSHLLHYIEYYSIDILLIHRKLLNTKNQSFFNFLSHLIHIIEESDDITTIIVDSEYTDFTSFEHNEQPYYDNQYKSNIKIDLFINQALQSIKKIDKNAFNNQYTNYTLLIQYVKEV